MHPAKRMAGSPATQIGPLILANLLASVAGGRVLSAGKGLTDLRLLGSGSLMALLAGSVVSLAIVDRARRARGGRGLVTVSAASLVCSGLLLVLYRQGSTGGASSGPGPVLRGPLAVAFFAVLVLRCALWFSGRSLRTGLVAGQVRQLLGVAEAAYFAGLVVGLVIGLPAWFGGDQATSAFILDLLLLGLVTLIDWSCTRALRTAAARGSPSGVGGGRPAWRIDRTFVQLTLSYALATIACQIVVFHLADTIARLPNAAARTWADPALASFYVGVAALGSLASQLKPVLVAGAHGRATLQVEAGGKKRAGSLAVALLAVGVLMLMGATMTWSAVAGARATPIMGLILIAASSALFEVYILALLGRMAAGGPPAVALSIGLAGSLATSAMFFMLLGGANPWIRIVVNVAGLALSAWLVEVWLRLEPTRAGADESSK